MPTNKQIRRTQSNGPSAMGVIGGALAATVGAWILYSKSAINHSMPLPDAISATRETFQSDAGGAVSYYVDRTGTGRPLVLLHSINAAASAYEMGPLFEQYRGKRPVYALDWSGYGFSERAERVYTAQLFAEVLTQFLREKVGAPADVVALSLGSEFAARAAFQNSALFDSLVLISPSGLNLDSELNGSMRLRSVGMSGLLHSAFAFPLWSQGFYDLLATRRSIRYFLEKSFVGPVPQAMIDYSYLTSHQPGAEHVPFYFVSGALFTTGISRTIYAGLDVPTLVIYDRDAYTHFEALPEVLNANPKWQAYRLVPVTGAAAV